MHARPSYLRIKVLRRYLFQRFPDCVLTFVTGISIGTENRLITLKLLILRRTSVKTFSMFQRVLSTLEIANPLLRSPSTLISISPHIFIDKLCTKIMINE